MLQRRGSQSKSARQVWIAYDAAKPAGSPAAIILRKKQQHLAQNSEFMKRARCFIVTIVIAAVHQQQA